MIPITITQHYLNNLWKWKCNLDEDSNQDIINFNDLIKTEWSIDFENLMRNRLLLGALRYGKIGIKNKPKYDRVESMIKRLTKYKETGNKEFLVDIANFCLLEFVERNHPNEHFSSIDDGEHVNIIK